MEALKIVLLCVVAACLYGIVHDQVTARVCVEYFTIGHPPVFAAESPTLLGLGWGIIATWWVGVILGGFLAIAARFGGRTKLVARELVTPVCVLMMVAAASAFLAGYIGYILAEQGTIGLSGPLAQQIATERHSLFLADAWAHSASYGVGFLGGMTICIFAVRTRFRRAKAAPAVA